MNESTPLRVNLVITLAESKQGYEINFTCRTGFGLFVQFLLTYFADTNALCTAQESFFHNLILNTQKFNKSVYNSRRNSCSNFTHNKMSSSFPFDAEALKPGKISNIVKQRTGMRLETDPRNKSIVSSSRVKPSLTHLLN